MVCGAAGEAVGGVEVVVGGAVALVVGQHESALSKKFVFMFDGRVRSAGP